MDDGACYYTDNGVHQDDICPDGKECRRPSVAAVLTPDPAAPVKRKVNNPAATMPTPEELPGVWAEQAREQLSHLRDTRYAPGLAAAQIAAGYGDGRVLTRDTRAVALERWLRSRALRAADAIRGVRDWLDRQVGRAERPLRRLGEVPVPASYVLPTPLQEWVALYCRGRRSPSPDTTARMAALRVAFLPEEEEQAVSFEAELGLRGTVGDGGPDWTTFRADS